MYQLNSPRPAWETLPTMYDLKSEDPEEPGLPDEFHAIQPGLLKETLRPTTYDLDDVFVGTDLNGSIAIPGRFTSELCDVARGCCSILSS
jgi:Uma2 family endonuclease